MTSQTGRPPLRAPKGLHPRARRFWSTVVDAYELDPSEAELLVEVVRLIGTLEDLQDALQEQGLVVHGSTGQLRPNPLLAELRTGRTVLSRLLAQLQLEDLDGEHLSSSTTARARKAARARWTKQATVHDFPGA